MTHKVSRRSSRLLDMGKAPSATAAPLTRDELAHKVEWEGGAFEALRYGIRSRDIDDPEVAALWREMETLYERISPVAWRIDSLLERAG